MDWKVYIMKRIKVNYVDTSKPIEDGLIQDEKMQFIHERLSQYYDVIITNKNPDIIFCDIYGIEYMKYDCIKVGVTVEEYAPDFNTYDYVITIFDEFQFKDRIFCYRVIVTLKKSREMNDLAIKKHLISEDDLNKKTEFCSFVQSNELGVDSCRIDFFHKLSKYKKVNSGGLTLNNVGGRVADKLDFESKHKFSISFINGKNYTLQDRPADAFAAKTVPIYWGNRDINKVLNKDAFINCHDFDSFDEVVEYIKVIDNDEDLYRKMLQTPAYINPVTLREEIKRFDDFLINIVENGSIQRSGAYYNKAFEKEVFYGREKRTRIIRAAHKLKPITKWVFASKLGQVVKKKILGVIHKKAAQDAYR